MKTKFNKWIKNYPEDLFFFTFSQIKKQFRPLESLSWQNLFFSTSDCESEHRRENNLIRFRKLITRRRRSHLSLRASVEAVSDRYVAIFTPFFNVFLFSWFFFSFFDLFFYFLPVFSLKKCSWKFFCLSWKKKICKKNVKTEIKIIFPWCEKLKIPDGIFLFEEKTNSGEFVKKCRRIFLPCVKLWFHV